MPLTDLQAKKSMPKDKPYRLADSAGLYLEIQPNGGKYWRLKFRFAGKEILSPDPALRDQIATYKQLSQLYATVRNAYAEKIGFVADLRGNPEVAAR
ncbi:Arm DNA-binding domain-containing protein [Uliginosibacterium paludis]|uniref:Arm DNA-binding domain-containing protein n=1 Tax=Uliginosibacterium paludis TaxID=1615952 RepID=A0ABV2CM71_9RHOO